MVLLERQSTARPGFLRGIRQLAASGGLQPSDLVWKEGMSQWTDARQMKGLFPDAPAMNGPMPPQWYYSQNNQQQGPVSSEQLKQLAASGGLQPGDLVWKEGMSQWTDARQMKGLFPMQTVANPPVPPPMPPSAVSPAIRSPGYSELDHNFSDTFGMEDGGDLGIGAAVKVR